MMLFREWFVVFLVGCFICVVFLAQSFSSKVPLSAPCSPLNPPKLEVWVSGAVQNPGVYEVEFGASLESVLARAKLKKNADKKAVYLKKKVLQSCSIKVPEKKYRKNKKKKIDFSTMYPTSYTDKNARNLSKASENVCA